MRIAKLLAIFFLFSSARNAIATSDYSDLKSVVRSRNLQWQYDNESNLVYIFAWDGPQKYDATLYKAGFEPVGIDTQTNADNLANFNSKYKDSANQAISLSRLSTYMAVSSAPVNSGIATGATTSIAYLFHSSTATTRCEILGIAVSYVNGSGNSGSFAVRLARITAENASPTGTSYPITPVDSGDSALDGTVFRYGSNAPVRKNGDLISQIIDASTFSAGLLGGVAAGNSSSFSYYSASALGKPLALNNGVAEGFEIRSYVISALSSAVPISVSFQMRCF